MMRRVDPGQGGLWAFKSESAIERCRRIAHISSGFDGEEIDDYDAQAPASFRLRYPHGSRCGPAYVAGAAKALRLAAQVAGKFVLPWTCATLEGNTDGKQENRNAGD
ncbi:MAG: hypothetical protein ACI8W7_001776 [Gammaproteobacteria bacterium]|jgi:hypothetical protein